MFLIRMRKLDISVRQRIVGKLVSRAFWRYIRFQHQCRGLWEISKKITITLPKLKCKQQTVAARAAITAAEFMNARYAAVLHRPQPGQPAATRPCPQITLGRLVKRVDVRLSNTAKVWRKLVDRPCWRLTSCHRPGPWSEASTDVPSTGECLASWLLPFRSLILLSFIQRKTEQLNVLIPSRR